MDSALCWKKTGVTNDKATLTRKVVELGGKKYHREILPAK
jgi:hypothetical protein